MATSGSSRPQGGNKKGQKDSSQNKSNLTGLKHQLHGTSYQVKLGIVVSTANAKKVLDPIDNFSFTVTAEDPTAGKFDDIVYAFQHGEKTGTLKIQAKHKLSLISTKNAVQDENTTTATESQVKNKQEASIPKIALNDFIVDSKNDFCIQQYFKSFLEQPLTTNQNSLEGLIICTNADLDDDAKVIWNEIDAAALGDSTTLLDSYITSLFDKTGGKCYQLKTHYKRAALVRLLVNAIKSKDQMVSWQRPLFKEYRAAILGIIDKDSISGNVPSFKFTDIFLDPTYSNSKPGYETFQMEFKEQFQREFGFNEAAWDRLKRDIQIHVAENFLLDEKNPHPSSDSFPEVNEEESLKSFCDRFRLVCGTFNEQGLDDTIVEIWSNLKLDDVNLGNDRHKERIEENIVTDKLFKTYFDWLKDPFAKPLNSDDIKAGLENIEGTLAYMKLKPISDKLRKKVVGSPFRVSANAPKASKLLEQTKSLIALKVLDIQFGATVLLDILDFHSKDHTTTLFLSDSHFVNDSKSVKAVLRSVQPPPTFVIICQKAFRKVQSIVQQWKKDILKDPAKHIFLIRKTNDIVSNLGCFRICDLTEESLNQFLGKTFPLCTTSIFPSKIFQNNFRELKIEDVIKLMAWGKQMEENNEISKKYHEIERTYVHRPWVDFYSNLKPENIWWNKDGPILKSMENPQQEGMSFNEIMDSLKKEPTFYEIFGKVNNQEEEHKQIIGDESRKIFILLGEAGFGKSTNLTWLAWHLRKRNPSSWVLRCNLSDYCTDFKPFIHDQNSGTGKVIDETEAMRMLYKLARSSLQLEREISEKCSKWLDLSDKKVTLKGDLTLEGMQDHGLSSNNLLQLLVFTEKFNAGELELLLDGFDEIAPHYKDVVLKFLSHFELFKGVRKLYLTSRPYGFKEHFENAFKDLSFFQLKPLSLHDKCSILYKIMKEKWHNENIDDEEASDFYKSLCYMLLLSLHSMSDVPLNLMMAVDILGDRVNHNENVYINRFSKTISRKLLEFIVKLSKASFIVEEFVKIKIRLLFYDKNGVDKSVADKPLKIDELEKAIDETKLLHGLVALFVIFNWNEVYTILSKSEIREAEAYMEEIHKGSEKTGIIHGIMYGRPIIIHRSFAEYLAAWWIVQQRIEGNQQDRKKISCLELFLERKELRKNIDIILARRHPLHLAIIERGWRTVESLLSTKPRFFYDRDDGKRTPLHLLVFYYDFEGNWPHFLPDSIHSQIIDYEEMLFGRTALDFAFHRDKPRLIFYLLHHGASINVDFLYGQVASAGGYKIRKAAKYARYVMEYLSHQGIEYESHDACKKMKQFCDKVVADFINEITARTYDRFSKSGCKHNAFSFINDIKEEDSVWMLQSVIEQGVDRKHFVRLIRNSYFDWLLDRESMLLLNCFMKNDPSTINDDNLWHCIVLSLNKNYKTEFKYFFDLYCSGSKIKDFQPCSIHSIQSDYFDWPIPGCIASYLMDYVENNVKRIISKFISIMYWSNLGLPTAVMVDEKILSLLVICVATVRPSMLRYLIESCKLNLCAGFVYSLAMVTNNLFSKLSLEVSIKPRMAYKCLLDYSSNISVVEANKILRLSITSKLFEFSIGLIERCNIDFQVVDDANGWNVFHLCVSNQRSFWFEEMTCGDTRASFVDRDKTDLFRFMLAKANDMDCFGNCDKKGRSILYLAMENERRDIVEHIVARKLSLDALNEIRNLSVDAIPNITFCYRTIHKVSKSIGQKWWHYGVLCLLAKQIAKISLTNRKKSQERNSVRLFLQENAKELYQTAIKCRSLFLLYYLHREFRSAIPTPIYDADWLACTARTLYSKDFVAVTKWLLNSNEVDDHANLYEVVEKCDNEGYNLTSVNLEKLVKQVEEQLSGNRSVEKVCKLKLLAVAVCLKNESMIRNVCETLNIIIDWKVLIEIMEIAHRSHIYKRRTKLVETCTFDWPDFVPIYEYLFEQTSNLSEIDAEGRNVSHLAAQYGLGCMAQFFIKHNKVNVMAINEQNGWNIFHYYASRKENWKYCFTENVWLRTCITKRMLEITSDGFPLSSLTESQRNKLKELCFNSNEGRKSVIHVAVEADNIDTAEYIIECRLGMKNIDQHEIRNSEECSRFRECYDELIQIAAQLPLNEYFDYLLHKLAKSIHRFSPETIEHIARQENGEDHIVEDVCRTAIKRRSVLILEHLMIACEEQMNQALAGSNSRELVVCMTECIRRNRTSMFKVLVGHFGSIQGIQPGMEVEFEMEENDTTEDVSIDESKIQISDEISEDVAMNRDYLTLLILSVAYGRLPMTQFLVEMLQLDIKKSLIVLIMKGLIKLWDDNCNIATPVYEFLASRCEGKRNLLHLSAQAECWTMLKYLIKEKKLDPNEVDSENEWNAGHYCVKSGFVEFKWLVEEYNMDCVGVYDRNDRSILHLALENGFNRVVEFIINRRLGLIGDKQPWYERDLEKIKKHIDELQHILDSLPEIISVKQQQVIREILEKLEDQRVASKTHKELFTNHA